MDDEAGEIKMFLLCFHVFFFHLSCWFHCSLETSKICSTMEPRNWTCFLAFCHHPMYPYYWKGLQKVRLSFSSSCFVERSTVLPGYRFWNGVGDSLSVSLCLPQELTSPCTVKHSSQLHGLLFPSHKVSGPWKSCFTGFHFRPSRSLFFFLITTMTLELKDTFQARLLVLRNWPLMRGRNL